MSGLNYIDSLDESKSRCDCPAWASFIYIFRFDTSTSRVGLKILQRQLITTTPDFTTSRGITSTTNRNSVNWNIQYKSYLTFKREAAQFSFLYIVIVYTSHLDFLLLKLVVIKLSDFTVEMDFSRLYSNLLSLNISENNSLITQHRSYNRRSYTHPQFNPSTQNVENYIEIH